jgi:L-asparaginase / beta-aspartyl-peptidase
MKTKYSLMIHGGAGMSHNVDEYAPSLRAILEAGEKMLASGSLALDVVEHCVSMLEDEPLYNAGRGSVLNSRGEIEMDASIMNGQTLAAGAIAAVRGIKNPVRLARMVMEKSRHVMLIADGAMEFAREQNAPTMPDEYFLSDERRLQWEKAAAENAVVLDHNSSPSTSKKLGTVGAVVMDTFGNLAAATSTGGLVNKKYGRVGDTPIIGAGVYADNETCAVSATGIGEHFIRTVLAKTISEIVRHKNVSAGEAAKMGIKYLVRKIEGLGGVIVIDKDGHCGSAFSTPTMIHGSVCKGGEIKLNFDAQINY